MGSTAPPAANLLRRVLDGLDELFTRTDVPAWAEIVREVGAIADPVEMARAYDRMSQGSASGTFHDLIISMRNGHAVTEVQEALRQRAAGLPSRALVEPRPTRSWWKVRKRG